MRRLVLLFAVLLMAGCAAPRAELDADRMGRLFVDAVQRGDWPAIDKGIAPSLMASPDHAERIEAVRKAFPADPPWSIRLLASRQVTPKEDGGQERAELQYLYQFAERRAVIDLTVVPVGWRKVVPATARTPRRESALLEEKPEPPAAGSPGYEVVRVYQALAMSYTEVTREDEAAQAFWAPGRTPGQWLFLGLSLATLGFMLWTAVRVLRAPGLEARIFWALLCLVGAGTAWMDWTSGIAGFLPTSLRLMGFGLEKGPSPLAPWMVSLTLPVGALLASLRLALLRLRTSP
ncbi:MAG: hypothetical protein RL588_1623 [Pseudomonadota bacterium]|jgi:hypothetical protein